ncbi:MAG: transposase [Tissierellia bacterium]|nr:transposase [Tissierellia bacterium]
MKNVENIEKVTTETITISREEYDNLIAQNLEMQKQIKWLMDTIKLKNNKIFGSSSEKTNKEESDQLSIFNEAEVESNLQVKEPELEEVKAHYRKKTHKERQIA